MDLFIFHHTLLSHAMRALPRSSNCRRDGQTFLVEEVITAQQILHPWYKYVLYVMSGRLLNVEILLVSIAYLLS